MVKVTFEFSAANVTRLVSAYGSGYEENEDETKAQFAKKQLLKEMKDRVLSYEERKAYEEISVDNFTGTVE